MKFTLCLILLFASFNNYAQQTIISGLIKDSKNNSNLAYVNIGIADKNVGTVSDSIGTFNLRLSDKVNTNDTIVLSLVGYETKKVAVNQLNPKNNIIALTPSTNTLQEVVVKYKQPKHKQFGRSAKGLGLMHMNFYSAYEKDVDDRLSKEVGMKFKIKKDCKVDNFNFNITSNEFKSVKFRLNFYTVENALPKKIIPEKDIIFEVKEGFSGMYTLDLKPYEIYLDKEMESIAVTIQWVESVKMNDKSKYFSISTAASPTETSFYREKAMDNWSKSSQSLTFFLNTMCK